MYAGKSTTAVPRRQITKPSLSRHLTNLTARISRQTLLCGTPARTSTYSEPAIRHHQHARARASIYHTPHDAVGEHARGSSLCGPIYIDTRRSLSDPCANAKRGLAAGRLGPAMPGASAATTCTQRHSGAIMSSPRLAETGRFNLTGPRRIQVLSF